MYRFTDYIPNLLFGTDQQNIEDLNVIVILIVDMLQVKLILTVLECRPKLQLKRFHDNPLSRT